MRTDVETIDSSQAHVAPGKESSEGPGVSGSSHAFPQPAVQAVLACHHAGADRALGSNHRPGLSRLRHDKRQVPARTGGIPQRASSALLSPIVGVVVDRFDRRKVLFATQAFMASTLFTLATLDALGVLAVSHILIIATLAGAASAFDWPARLSLVPNIVSRNELQSAVAFNSASFNGARIAGPAIGGFLIGIIGTAACFYLSAFAFLPSMVVLMTLTIDRAVASGVPESPIQNLLSGYRYIWTYPTLRSLLSVDLVPVMFGMSFFALLPALSRDVYNEGSQGLGLLYSADGAGSPGRRSRRCNAHPPATTGKTRTDLRDVVRGL